MDGLYGASTLTLPLSWLTALATSDLRLAIFGLRGLYGLMRFLHLTSMGIFLGMVVLLDLRRLGAVPAQPLHAIRPQLGALLHWSFWLSIASGLGLFIYNPLGIGLHSMFLPKLALVAAGYALARSRALASAPRSGAVLSLTLWLLVIAGSTWNHVERPQRVGDALRSHTIGKP